MTETILSPDLGKTSRSLESGGADEQECCSDSLFDIEQLLDPQKCGWSPPAPYEDDTSTGSISCPHDHGFESKGPSIATSRCPENFAEDVEPELASGSSTLPSTLTSQSSTAESPCSCSSVILMGPSPLPSGRRKRVRNAGDGNGTDPKRPTRRERSRPLQSALPGHQQVRIRRKTEKKYRSKLATNLDQLRASVPSLLSDDDEDSPEAELFGLITTRKRSKATIICKAAEFIEQMKDQYKKLHERVSKAEMEVILLRTQNEQLRSGAIKSPSTDVDMLEARILASIDWFRQATCATQTTNIYLQ